MTRSPLAARSAVAFLLVVLAVAGAPAAAGAAGKKARRPEQARPPNILLITVDTLRADHVSAYRSGPSTTPFIDSLAKQGILFRRAYSTSSWTTPALVSLLTASYPGRHGMGGPGQGADGRWAVIPSDLATLPEALRQRGYRTYGLTANFGLPADRGFARGFDKYECLGAVDVEQVRARLDAWLPEIEAHEPWFTWLHLFDPHAPYQAREPWISSLWSQPREGLKHLDGMNVGDYQQAAASLPRQSMDYVRALYDSEIRAVDASLGDLFDHFPGAKDALVVVTADHGEEFLEHGGTGHGRTLFDESTHVPLIVRLPDGRFGGTSVDAAASLVDVMPTVLDLVGAPLPADCAGRSLIGPGGPRKQARKTVVAELERQGLTRAITDGRYKLVTDPALPDAPALYDLAADPGETTDIAARDPERLAFYEQLLAAFERRMLAGRLAPGETALTREQAEALRALGYVH
jgi:arylsulfatase A-like enzyme